MHHFVLGRERRKISSSQADNRTAHIDCVMFGRKQRSMALVFRFISRSVECHTVFLLLRCSRSKAIALITRRTGINCAQSCSAFHPSPETIIHNLFAPADRPTDGLVSIWFPIRVFVLIFFLLLLLSAFISFVFILFLFFCALYSWAAGIIIGSLAHWWAQMQFWMAVFRHFDVYCILQHSVYMRKWWQCCSASQSNTDTTHRIPSLSFSVSVEYRHIGR